MYVHKIDINHSFPPKKDVTLTAAIHDFHSGQDWDLIDVIEVSFQGRSTSAPISAYNGIYGIASISFSYVFFTGDEDLNSTNVETSKFIYKKMQHLCEL